ncbi:MAG: hypothetical protein NZ805_05285 [Armatimonadetes bacterium]|nr:hypothetical protein [Armatimonadota bacterium]MDW8028014.1 hypothetical protein [Armatimonadota bacterium]
MKRWQFYLTLTFFASFAFAQMSSDFALKVLERKGTVEVQLPDGVKQTAKKDERIPAGISVITQAKSIAILEWLPYKARIKLAPETEVQLLTTRAFLVKRGRVWIGTPPSAAWERRFPLPVQSGQIQFVSSPDACFSIAIQTDGTVTISVDQGRVFVSSGQALTSVSKGNMLVIKPQNVIIGPMAMTKEEQLMWDMGGLR